MGKAVTEAVTETQESIVVEPIVKQIPAPNQSHTGLWTSIVILLISFILAGIGYYLLIQLDTQQQMLRREIQHDDQNLIELNKQITNYQEQLVNLQQQLATTNEKSDNSNTSYEQKFIEFGQRFEEKLTTQHQTQAETILRLQRQLGKTRGDWLLADAEYLLSVANQRLHLMGDIKTTSEALSAADQRLRESGDAAAFKIREQITKEQSAIKAVAEIDVIGNYSILQMLIGKVEKLDLLLPYTGKPLTEAKKVHSHPATEEHDLLDAALKQVEGYVTIRHIDEPVKEILTPQQAVFIREQLRIRLEMVKLALVQKDTTLYSQGLKDTLQWVTLKFVNNQKLKAFNKQLTELKKNNIQSKLPDISQSLKMLRDITKLRIETDKALLNSKPKAEKTTAITPSADTTITPKTSPDPTVSKQDLKTNTPITPEAANPASTSNK